MRNHLASTEDGGGSILMGFLPVAALWFLTPDQFWEAAARFRGE